MTPRKNIQNYDLNGVNVAKNWHVAGGGTFVISYRLVALIKLVVFVCVCLFVFMCVRSHISHYNFVKCAPIVTKLDMVLTGYDIYMVEKYHRNRSNAKVKVTKNMKITV